MDIPELCDRILAGDRRAVARAISVVEDSDPAPVVSRLHAHGGRSRIVGVTGAPGTGKSSLTDRLISEARSRQLTVAVVAIDPSSPFTGGAVLGDRIRMQDHVSDSGVY
ncbi:MAG: methylmalonyl Co-A mutase-associated GTPase MeaB, partial [Acidimicrobiia bacterium]|nr:methylmalonyl Co-A mutase-associated GTPase MeaB [Acidimicrobiia bacterium]